MWHVRPKAEFRFPDFLSQKFLLNFIYFSCDSKGTEALNQLVGNSTLGIHQTHSQSFCYQNLPLEQGSLGHFIISKSMFFATLHLPSTTLHCLWAGSLPPVAQMPHQSVEAGSFQRCHLRLCPLGCLLALAAHVTLFSGHSLPISSLCA